MRKSIKGSSGSLAAVIAAVGTAAVTVLSVGSLVWIMLEEEPLPAAAGIMAVYVLFGAAVVFGVFAALRQRLREIGKGEADEARKY